MTLGRFAKLIRLRRARELLLKFDSRQSVTAVAFACGFSNLGHFARDYRAAFDELPSATLAGSMSSGRDCHYSDQNDNPGGYFGKASDVESLLAVIRRLPTIP
jgi:AraC-like DNA-binding protein